MQFKYLINYKKLIWCETIYIFLVLRGHGIYLFTFENGVPLMR